MRKLHALFVDDEEELRDGYIENLRLALRNYDIALTCDSADTIEQAVEVLEQGQQRYGLVLADLLWDALGTGRGGRDSRGLEVIGQAAKTAGVVIVAITASAPWDFPDLEPDARARGAQVFRIRGALQASSRTGGWESLAEEIATALQSARDAGGAPRPPSVGADRRSVFVVCGRDSRRNESIRQFLRALGLDPREWGALVAQASRQGAGANPNVLEVVRIGFELAHGAVVLMTPDDDARLRGAHHVPPAPDGELEPRGQPRPNVLLEAGYAICHARDRTIIVIVGDVTLPSDLEGLNILRLDDAARSRKAFAERLRETGFAVSTEGDDWLRVGDFSA